MLLYVVKRVGLALVTLVLLSLIIFFAAQVLPGDPGRAILGPFASQHSVDILDHRLGVDRPVVVQYWSWITGIVRGQARDFIPVPGTGQLLLVAVPGEIAEAGGPCLCHRRAHGHPGRDHRSPEPGTVAGPSHQHDEPLTVDGARVRLRRRPHRPVLDRPEVAARHRQRAGGVDLHHPGALPDPSRHSPRDYPLRLHRPDGPGRHRRGARLRLRPHGDAEGAAPLGRDPAARAAQLAAADDHRHRHPDRVPDRRPRRGREALHLPGRRHAHPECRQQQGLPDARGGSACSSASSTSWRR